MSSVINDVPIYIGLCRFLGKSGKLWKPWKQFLRKLRKVFCYRKVFLKLG